jgi:transcriptional regulator with XRE-family HTH domain
MASNEDHPLRDVLPLAEAFGRGLRSIRTQHGLTLDKVASTASLFGLKWSTARVLEFEKGKIPITLPTLMRLGTTLTALTGQGVTISDMLDWGHWLELPGAGSGVIHADAFRQAFAGGPVDIRQGDDAENERDDALDASSVLPEVPPGITARQLKFMHEYAGLADERASKKLGMTLDEFLAFAFPMLGISLSERTMSMSMRFENGDLVDDGPQARGHLSRKLSRIVGAFAELYKSGDTSALEIMANLHSLWGESEDEKASLQNRINEVLRAIDSDFAPAQSTDFGLSELGPEKLERENWQLDGGMPDEAFYRFAALIFAEEPSLAASHR